MGEQEEKKYKKVFTFSRGSTQNASIVSKAFAVPSSSEDKAAGGKKASIPLPAASDEAGLPAPGPARLTPPVMPGDEAHSEKPVLKKSLPPASGKAGAPKSPSLRKDVPLPPVTPPRLAGSPGSDESGLIVPPPEVAALLPGGDSMAEIKIGGEHVKGAYPKVIVSALKDKVSYMTDFQAKINQLSKQLKGLLNKAADAPRQRPLPRQRPAAGPPPADD